MYFFAIYQVSGRNWRANEDPKFPGPKAALILTVPLYSLLSMGDYSTRISNTQESAKIDGLHFSVGT